ncbi:MAG: phosphodiester glycosidase family protein [Cyanobacteria bacterium P01_D01_bin.56]
MDNPDLSTYIEQILNRSEFRRYQCVNGIRYDITVHNAALPADCKVHSALGAGPQLLPDDTSQAEGFTDYANGELIRDAIGSQRRNARSAIGVKQDGTVVWVMVAQVNESGGMTLAELAEYMTSLAIQKALNLDGGSSASLYLAPQLLQGRTTQTNSSLRPVKSVLLLPSS